MFFNQIPKKIVKVTRILPGKKKKKHTTEKKKSMQAKHKFFLFVTYIYKRSETTYKFKKNVYVQLFTAKKMV